MKVYGDKIYDEQFALNGWGEYPSEEVIRFFMYARKKLPHNGLKALDIGCGVGACSWFMAREGAEVTAMDGAPSGLKRVKEVCNRFYIDKKITTVHGNITNPLAYISSKFNIILDSYALYSNKEEETVNGYEECYHLLEKGGYFLTCCFGKKTDGYKDGDQLSENTFNNIKGTLSNGGIQSIFSKESLLSILKNIGYKLEYYENILEERDQLLIEKHVACLSK